MPRLLGLFLGLLLTGVLPLQAHFSWSFDGAGNANQEPGQALLGPATATQGGGQLAFQAGSFGAQLKTWRWELAWNARGQLAQVQTSAAAVAAGDVPRKLVYSYDAEGRRWQRQSYVDANGDGALDGAPAESTYWVHDGWRPLYEVTLSGAGTPGSGTVLRERRYVWGLDSDGTPGGLGGVGGLVAIETRSGGTGSWAAYFPKYDSLGSVVALIDSAGAEN